MKVLAYLVFGEKLEYQRELALSVLSALSFTRTEADPVTICVVTDRKPLAYDLPVDVLLVSPEEFSSWTRGKTYLYRAKICAVQKVLAQYAAPVAFVDTDTFFTQSPARLFDRVGPQESLMHDFEYAIGDSSLWSGFVAQVGTGIEMEGVPISPRSPMYNSGVIGVHPANAGLLETTLAVMDRLHAMAPIFNVEQFALGVVLGGKSKLATCPEVLAHYWGFPRYFYHVQAARMLDGYQRERIGALLDALRGQAFGVPPKSKPDQALTRLLAAAKRWDRRYSFAYLAYRSAFSVSRTDAAYANAWAKVALEELEDLLKDGRPEGDGAGRTALMGRCRKDFKLLSPARIDRLGWLSPDVKGTWLRFWGR